MTYFRNFETGPSIISGLVSDLPLISELKKCNFPHAKFNNWNNELKQWCDLIQTLFKGRYFCLVFVLFWEWLSLVCILQEVQEVLRSAVGMAHVLRSGLVNGPPVGVRFRESLVITLYSEIDQIHLDIEA